MTYEEALYCHTHNGATIEQEIECESLIKEALEKQIPKKPQSVESYTNIIDYYCPVCDINLISKINGEFVAGRKDKYCSNCGKALDWSSENENL